MKIFPRSSWCPHFMEMNSIMLLCNKCSMVPLRVRRSKSTFPQQLTGNKFSGYSVKKQKKNAMFTMDT